MLLLLLLLLRCSRVRVVTHVAGKSCAGMRSGHIRIKSGTECVNNNNLVNSMHERVEAIHRFLIFMVHGYFTIDHGIPVVYDFKFFVLFFRH